LRNASATGEGGEEKSGVAVAFGHEEILCGMRKNLISTVRGVDWHGVVTHIDVHRDQGKWSIGEYINRL
jgi:hypothetical protein